MKILVTGATGFMGRAFCVSAASSGHKVMGLSRTEVAQPAAGYRVVRGSLSDPPWDEIERFAPEVALHLAWIATPGLYLASSENDILVQQSEDFFRGLAQRGVAHLAGTGTCIEYAPSPMPLREDASRLAPAFPYSRAKVETCQRLKALSEAAGTAWTWFRVFYPYGEGEHPDRMPSVLMRKLAAGEELELKTPDSVKDYIHVADAAGAMLAALEYKLTGPVNIGTGTGLRIMDLALAIARCCGSDARLVRSAATPAADPFPITVANTSKLFASGWRPRVELEAGLARLRDSRWLN